MNLNMTASDIENALRMNEKLVFNPDGITLQKLSEQIFSGFDDVDVLDRIANAVSNCSGGETEQADVAYEEICRILTEKGFLHKPGFIYQPA